MMTKKKQDYEWKRVGRCQPTKCGALCCRCGPSCITTIKPDKVSKDPKKDNEDYWRFYELMGWAKISEKKIKGGTEIYYGNPRSCSALKGNRCSIYKDRPKACKTFPASPDHNYYKMVKKYCTYKFIKVPKKKPKLTK